VAPGQNAHDRPLILEEGVRLPPAPKEAVPVTFIWNLRGFACPLCKTRPSPSSWYIDCKLAKEECELVLSHEVCTTQEPGQATGGARPKTNRQRQKCMKTNNLPHGVEVLCGLPQPTPASSRSSDVHSFRSAHTKDALLSLQKILLLFILCKQRERETGAFLVRKTKPARRHHHRQLIQWRADWERQVISAARFNSK
jgi:hypothetical protein